MRTEQATASRDAVAKAIYSKLFDWIVQHINSALDLDPSPNPALIGILDIFGFEDMATNGFEQLFINTTNENLQKLFNDMIFKAEAEEYNREQIEWDQTIFPDNDPCIQLLTKKPVGLLRMMDSECSRGNAASDGEKLVAKLNKSHGSHQYYDVCGPATVWRRKNGKRTEPEDFVVHHFAGAVIYTVSEFVPKNRDAVFGHVYVACRPRCFAIYHVSGFLLFTC